MAPALPRSIPTPDAVADAWREKVAPWPSPEGEELSAIVDATRWSAPITGTKVKFPRMERDSLMPSLGRYQLYSGKISLQPSSVLGDAEQSVMRHELGHAAGNSMPRILRMQEMRKMLSKFKEYSPRVYKSLLGSKFEGKYNLLHEMEAQYLGGRNTTNPRAAALIDASIDIGNTNPFAKQEMTRMMKKDPSGLYASMVGHLFGKDYGAALPPPTLMEKLKQTITGMATRARRVWSGVPPGRI
jgi:hypothetical protein